MPYTGANPADHAADHAGGSDPLTPGAIGAATTSALTSEATSRAGADSTLTTDVATNTGAISTHAALTTPAHGGIAPTAHAHAHSALTGVGANDHHAQGHGPDHGPGGADDLYMERGHASAARATTMSRIEAAVNVTLASGTALFTCFTPALNLTITNLLIAEGSAAATLLTLVRLGLYTVDGSGNMTLVARSASDTAIFSTANTLYTKALDTTGGYPASYALLRGVRYALGLVAIFTGVAPTPKGAQPGAILTGLLPIMSRTWAGQTDLPTSAPLASTGATGNLIWMAAT